MSWTTTQVPEHTVTRKPKLKASARNGPPFPVFGAAHNSKAPYKSNAEVLDSIQNLGCLLNSRRAVASRARLDSRVKRLINPIPFTVGVSRARIKSSVKRLINPHCFHDWCLRRAGVSRGRGAMRACVRGAGGAVPRSSADATNHATAAPARTCAPLSLLPGCCVPREGADASVAC